MTFATISIELITLLQNYETFKQNCVAKKWKPVVDMCLTEKERKAGVSKSENQFEVHLVDYHFLQIAEARKGQQKFTGFILYKSMGWGKRYLTSYLSQRNTIPWEK